MKDTRRSGCWRASRLWTSLGDGLPKLGRSRPELKETVNCQSHNGMPREDQGSCLWLMLSVQSPMLCRCQVQIFLYVYRYRRLVHCVARPTDLTGAGAIRDSLSKALGTLI